METVYITFEQFEKLCIAACSNWKEKIIDNIKYVPFCGRFRVNESFYQEMEKASNTEQKAVLANIFPSFQNKILECYKGEDEAWEKLIKNPFVGFCPQSSKDLRYMLVSPLDNANPSWRVAARAGGNWTEPCFQQVARGTYIVFETPKELYTWLSEGTLCK